MKMLFTAVTATALLVGAPFALAGECVGGMCSLPAPTIAVEKALDLQAAPSAREIQASVDGYLASATSDASLVGGCGSAGYDGGFWIRGGTFLMKINLTLQTRWEGFDWDDTGSEPGPGGDLSGFSLPRVTLKFSGDATCDVHYYAELEFGHSGLWFDNGNNISALQTELVNTLGGRNTITGVGTQSASDYYGIAREAWIEYEAAPQLAFRMGLIKTATTRQMMTPPEMQQFVDVSVASVFVGMHTPGYTDRNRDYGFMVHGGLGCDGAWQYMLTVTNGDGPVHRNVLDGETDDPLAYSARVNWDIKGHMGYEEGALRQHSCEFVASIGAWSHYCVDHISENPINHFSDRLTYGVDLAAGWGGFSLTAAYNVVDFSYTAGSTVDGWSWLAQVGYLFPDTAWEIAARYDVYHFASDFTAAQYGVEEMAVAVNYYIDGHADKVTLDVAFLTPTDDGNRMADTYAGYNVTFDSDATMLRLQWQLAL